MTVGLVRVQDLVKAVGPCCNEGLLVSYFSPDTMIFRGEPATGNKIRDGGCSFEA